MEDAHVLAHCRVREESSRAADLTPGPNTIKVQNVQTIKSKEIGLTTLLWSILSARNFSSLLSRSTLRSLIGLLQFFLY